MDKEVTLGDMIANKMFTEGLAGVDRLLEEYYESLFMVTLSYSISSEMTFNAAVTHLMDNLPPFAKSCKCIRCYVDDETHEVTCIYHKNRIFRERFEELNREYGVRSC
ncbi:MAG: hypothetical protein IMF19_12060 [Proteobacteria bacterium]|nr:hypothetical protein [Pseudomonadota bacterium]